MSIRYLQKSLETELIINFNEQIIVNPNNVWCVRVHQPLFRKVRSAPHVIISNHHPVRVMVQIL